MKKVLIISGHTDLRTSVANKAILEVLANKLPDAEIAELDSLYPDFNIDVKAEQRRLISADIIVLQFPIFWYSAPSLLERWMEATFLSAFHMETTVINLKERNLSCRSRPVHRKTCIRTTDG